MPTYLDEIARGTFDFDMAGNYARSEIRRLVVDISTPSCGSRRFGRWGCIILDKDRSMEATIKNDEE